MDKLLIIQVDIGEKNPRQIVAGIAKHYTPESIEGKNVVVVVNLEPVKLRGEESNGMLLAGSNKITMKLVTVDGLNPGDNIS